MKRLGILCVLILAACGQKPSSATLQGDRYEPAVIADEAAITNMVRSAIGKSGTLVRVVELNSSVSTGYGEQGGVRQPIVLLESDLLDARIERSGFIVNRSIVFDLTNGPNTVRGRCKLRWEAGDQWEFYKCRYTNLSGDEVPAVYVRSVTGLASPGEFVGWLR